MTHHSEKGTESLDRLAKDVERLSRLLTKDRDRLPAAYLRDRGLREAYVAYFLPANVPKIAVALEELALHPAGLFIRDRMRVLDIGCGPGTSILGVLDYFGRAEVSPELEFTAVDAVRENLQAAEVLVSERLRSSGRTAALRTVCCGAGDVAARLRGPFDLIILSNVLNELFLGEKERIAKRVNLVGSVLRELLDEQGSCIVIEPALRETSRELLLVRDGLRAEGCRIYAPCLVQDACPALEHSRDWCHEDRPWVPPAVIAEIDERTGLRKDSLKFSYLVLRKDKKALSDHVGPEAFRVVSEPIRTRGKLEYFLCGPGGRRLVVRLDKETAQANTEFGELRRGDVVRFEGLVDEERRWRVARATVVHRLVSLSRERSQP